MLMDWLQNVVQFIISLCDPQLKVIMSFTLKYARATFAQIVHVYTLIVRYCSKLEHIPNVVYRPLLCPKFSVSPRETNLFL